MNTRFNQCFHCGEWDWNHLLHLIHKVFCELKIQEMLRILGHPGLHFIFFTCTPTFIAALFTIAKKQEQPKSPLTEEWINKMQYIRTVQYYSTLKSKAILSYATTWMNLEGIMLSEITSPKKDKNCMIPLIWGT